MINPNRRLQQPSRTKLAMSSSLTIQLLWKLNLLGPHATTPDCFVGSRTAKPTSFKFQNPPTKHLASHPGKVSVDHTCGEHHKETSSSCVCSLNVEKKSLASQ